MNPVVVENELDLGPRGIEILERAAGQTGLGHQLLEGRRRLRDIRGMLEEQRVAGRQLRRQDACDLIIWEIPRLDGQQNAKRLTDENGLAFGRIQNRQLFRRQQRLGVAGVIFEDLCRQFDLGLGFAEQLAHLQRQQPRIGVAVPAQDVGGRLQNPAAFGEGRLLPGEKRLMRGGDRRTHLVVGRIRKGSEGFPRIWIDGLVGH